VRDQARGVYEAARRPQPGPAPTAPRAEPASPETVAPPPEPEDDLTEPIDEEAE